MKALIRVTNDCNIRCRHCYMSAGDIAKKSMSIGEFRKYIDKLSADEIDNVVITGGQPTLLGLPLLVEFIRYAALSRKNSAFPKTVEITTNAHFGRSREMAMTYCLALKQAGLDRMRLSGDIYHREFLPESFEHNIVAAADRCGLSIKSMEVVPNISTNVDSEEKKIFALRPGGRALGEKSGQWDNINVCRIRRGHCGEFDSVFVDVNGDVSVCNAGTPSDLIMGNLGEATSIKGMLNHPSGICQVLAEGDVEGLGECCGLLREEVEELISKYGRCGACHNIRARCAVSLGLDRFSKAW
jgi:hypothetical protein